MNSGVEHVEHVSKKDRRRRHLAPNPFLTGLTLSLNFASNAGAILVTAWLNARGFGILANAHIPRVWGVALGVLALDASTYSARRLMHVIGPAWLLGLPVEAIALYRVLSVFMAVFEHVNVKLWQPLDTALSFVIGTPNMHKLHHSRAPSETNTNYGNSSRRFNDKTAGPSMTAPSTPKRDP